MSAEQMFMIEYTNALKALVRNDKAQINMLSMLAEDNKNYVNGIVAAIENHILTCAPPVKLPALYLVDSIIKNVKEPYKTAFSVRLDEVFGAVWDTTLQDKRASLSKLFSLWTGVLPPHVLEKVQRRMVSSSNGGPRVTIVPQQQSASLMPVQQPAHLQQQPTIIVQQSGMQLQGQYGLAAPQYQAVQQPPAPVYAVPQQFMGMPQHPPTLVSINGTLVSFSALQQPPRQQPILIAQQPMAAVSNHGSQHNTPHHSSQHATPQHVMQAGQPLGLPSPGHPGWQQQQPVMNGPGPMVRRSPGSPAAAVAQQEAVRPPPPPRGRQHARKSASPLPNSATLTTDALNKLLSNLTSGTLSGRQNEVEAVQKVIDFNPAFIKVLCRGQHGSNCSAGSSVLVQHEPDRVVRLHTTALLLPMYAVIMLFTMLLRPSRWLCICLHLLALLHVHMRCPHASVCTSLHSVCCICGMGRALPVRSKKASAVDVDGPLQSWCGGSRSDVSAGPCGGLIIGGPNGLFCHSTGCAAEIGSMIRRGWWHGVNFVCQLGLSSTVYEVLLDHRNIQLLCTATAGHARPQCSP